MFCYKFWDERLRFYESETSWFDLKRMKELRFVFFSELQHFFAQKKTPLSLQFDSSSPPKQTDRLLHAVCKRSSSEAAWEVWPKSGCHQPSKWQKETRYSPWKLGKWSNPTHIFQIGWTQQTGIQVYMLKITLLRFFVVIVGKMVHDWRFKKVFEHLCELTGLKRVLFTRVDKHINIFWTLNMTRWIDQ